MATKNQLVTFIKNQLGYPSIEIEVSDSVIESFIDNAILIYSPYYEETSFIEKPAADVVDLSGLNISNVVRVYETYMSGLNSQIDIDNSLFNIILNPTDMSTLVDYSVESYKRAEVGSLIYKGFKFIDNKLYLDDYTSSSVTIECHKDITDVSELSNGSLALSWILKYALALAKVAVGQVRRKFTFNNSPFSMDGDSLVTEGMSAKESLEDQLKGDAGFFFVTR
jgi:hypothetical protein